MSQSEHDDHSFHLHDHLPPPDIRVAHFADAHRHHIQCGQQAVTAGCLSGTTLIHHEVHDAQGERTTHKWVPVQRLYERFNRIATSGKGKGRLIPASHTFHLPSMNSDRAVVMGSIASVQYCGTQDAYELVTESGFRLTATADQQLSDGTSYVAMGDLESDAAVLVHNNTTKKRPGEKKRRVERKYFYVKWHPTAPLKVVNDKKTGKSYPYFVLLRSHAVVEAATNEMTVGEYLHALESWQAGALWHVPEGYEVHHIDENPLNDTLENLLLTTHGEHAKGHLIDPERDNFFRFLATPEKVISVRAVGPIQAYAITMQAPLECYVASGIVLRSR
jgi:hypothetical protein